MELWDLIPAEDLTAFARDVLPDNNPDTLNAYLPDRVIPGLRSRVARHSRRRTVAQYRSFNTETPIGQRAETASVTEVALPPLGLKLPITEWETLQLAVASAGGNGAAGALVQQAYDDTETVIEAIRNRLEIARADLLVTGAFTLAAENGLVLSADYGLAVSHKPTVALSWADEDALILDDELAWQQQVRTDSGRTPVRAVISSQVLRWMSRNVQLRSAYYGGSYTSQPNLNLAQLNGLRSDNGLHTLVVNDSQLPDPVTGQDRRLIPVDRYVLMADNIGETQFGITAEALALAGSNAVDFTVADAPGIFAATYKQADPYMGWVKANATAMPVLADVDGLLSADLVP